MCLNGMCLKIRTSTCFLHGSRAPNSSAFERNYCRTALFTCLYFAFICSSYTKHTFMVDRRGNAPRLSACKAEVLLLSLPAHKLDAFLSFALSYWATDVFYWNIRQDSNLRPKDYAICCLHLRVARVAGLEPATKWLTATYSTIEPYPNNTRHILNISFLSSLNIQWTLFPRARELQLGTYII